MYKYIYVETKEVRNTVTTIPQELWAKKGLLPYELKVLKFTEGEPAPVEGFEVLEDKVIETRIDWVKPFNLEEYKELKYSEVVMEGKAYSFGKYSIEQQSAAGFGWYSDEDNKTIVDFGKNNFDRIRALGDSIFKATTKAEVDSFKWVD